MMELSPAGIDIETDDIRMTDAVVKCHSDFEDCFTGSDVTVGTRE